LVFCRRSPGRFPAWGGGFLDECREEIPKLLQPVD
jgi:hypothetical protein